MLILEQPTITSPSGGATATESWRAIWKRWKAVVPSLLMSSVLLLEMVAYRLWLTERFYTAAGLLLVVLAAALPFLVVLAVVALTILFALLPFPFLKPSRRTLRLDEKGLRLSQTKYDRVLWKNVRRWLVAPFPGQEGLIILTLEAGGQSGGRFWSIVLEGREQKHAFLSEVAQLRQLGKTDAPIVELSQPLPERRPVLRGLWPLVLGCYLFIHGLPLLAVGAMPFDAKETHSSPDLSPAEQAKLEGVLRKVFQELHISNWKQFRMLFLVPGAILTATGLALAVLGKRHQRREAAEVNRLHDLEVDKITCGRIGSDGPHRS